MKIDILEIKDDDIVLALHKRTWYADKEEFNRYYDKMAKILKEAFGCRQVFVIPGGEDWDFTIVKNPRVKKVARKR